MTQEVPGSAEHEQSSAAEGPPTSALPGPAAPAAPPPAAPEVFAQDAADADSGWLINPAPPQPTTVIPDPYGPPPVVPGAPVAGEVPPAWQPPGDVLGGPRRPERGFSPVLLVFGCLIVALVAGLFGGAAGSVVVDRWRDGGVNRPISLPAPKSRSTERDSASVAGIAQRVLPSVVLIEVDGAQGQGTGSGFIIREDGYIVTNNHVVDGATDGGAIKVKFLDRSVATATIVGQDASYDLAAIKVSRKDLPALSFGDSESVVVGDDVIAVGAPLGLGGTVTTGIVSALDRPVSAGGGEDSPAFINAIQTDAAINPGNSGGPLVNGSGEVIGVNSAIARIPSASSMGPSGSIGLGFSIPSGQARRTVEQLIRDGKATHPVIGVLLDRQYQGEGVRIASRPADRQQPLTPGGPAAKAGLKPGDIFLKIDGQPVTDPDALVVGIRAKAPGDIVEFLVRTGKTERIVRVTLEASAD